MTNLIKTIFVTCILLCALPGSAMGQQLLMVGGGEYESGSMAFIRQLATVVQNDHSNSDPILVPYATAGFKASLTQLDEHEIDFAIATQDALQAKLQHHSGPDHSFRALARLVPGMLHVLVRVEDVNASFAELSRQPFSLGLDGWTYNSRLYPLLAAQGLDLTRVEKHLYPFAIGLKKLIAGEIGVLIFVDLPLSHGVTEALATHGVALKSLNREITKAYIESTSKNSLTLISQNPYMETDDFTTIGVNTFLVTNDNLSPVLAQLLADASLKVPLTEGLMAPLPNASSNAPIPWHEAIAESPELVENSQEVNQ